MDLVSKTLILCLALALTRAGPLLDSAAGKGKPPKCSDVKLGAITTDNAGTTYVFADIMERHCEHHRKRVEARGRLIGAFLPACDDNGQYLPDQRHGSTGYHWCADSKGRKIPGTATPPGVPDVDCSKPSRVYMRLDTIRDGLHSLPITRAWQEVRDRVEAAFSYTDKMYLIKDGEIYVYLVGSNVTRIGDRPRYLIHEMGLDGPVDAAFVCPDEHVAHIIQGNRMKDVDLSATPWTVIRDVPLPLSDIDAGLCGPDGIKLFKGSEYYHYESPMILAMGRIVSKPKKITSAILGCED
ncbi:hemopexin-like [Melanotaenia boesemani]|uniref:hemopexin-like n=1 Tax=Melanotaenia boesemani TaxID=1250792 RepID=UPI001C0471EE|nr:hemopexin-like [Melanotaenia boesemani]